MEAALNRKTPVAISKIVISRQATSSINRRLRVNCLDPINKVGFNSSDLIAPHLQINTIQEKYKPLIQRLAKK